MKTVLILLGVIVGLGALGALFGMIGLGDIKKMVVRDIDLSTVPDGVYRGSFHKARWNHEVEVTVKDHRLVSVKKIDKATDAARKKIFDQAVDAMLGKQSVRIDVVSGATVDTRAVQKAVEDALAKAAAAQ